MTVRPTAQYSIGSLAEAAGVSRRTVRFYVQRELLPPPEGLGRGAHYTAGHLARLLQIKGWQEQGVPLEEIRSRLRGILGPPAESRRSSRDGTRPGVEPPGHSRRAGSDLNPLVRSTTTASRTWLFPAAPGSSWFRQPLVAGFELHVSGNHHPLSAGQLAALASSLRQILENGAEES